MASVTATINVQINAANAAAQLTALQGKVASMNKGMLAATAGGVMAQEKAIKRMGNVLGSSGMFTTGIRNVHTELGRMHKEFDRGSTTLQHYRQNSKMWGKDHSAINRLAADRVKMLQSQYVALGKEMNGVQKAMQIKPTGMMREFGADAMYATQQQMLFRRNLQMGSTALVNWGKNTQWAGRQMMVGMGIPIALVAAGAIKSFNDIEKSSIAFKRVYGDTTTTVAEKSQMLAKVQQTVGKEMLKYGVSMADTLDMSARAAATGAKGADLIAATRETMRLATLGNMDYNKSLDAVIAMQTAFNIKSSDMAKTTDFLNAVENQTILSMQDMAVAVPRVAPVIKGLGGNVQDLAVMMTALRQGGVSAEQGANALKSGLGSLLNPTSTAIKQFDGLGINLQKIVDTNKGDIIGTLQGLGKALDGLTKYDRQRALEGLFGKYQYSRMGALLKNINSKAAKETMKLAKTNAGELARMSNQELSQISDSPMIKLKAAIEGIKAAAAPLGAVLSDIAAKIVNIATPIVSFFSNNDIAKWALIGTAGIAALAGTFTMVFGVLANFAGSMVKAGMSVKNFFRIITGRGSLAYITSEELEASAAANSLATAAERAGQGLMAESRAAQLLTSQLNALSAAQLKAAGSAGALASAPLAKTAVVSKPDAAASSIIPKVGHAELATMQRSHLGGMVALSESQIREVMAYQGISPKIRSALDNAIQNGIPVTGGNARSIYLPEAVNQALGRKGMQATALAEQLAAQGRNMTMAPLMQVIGRNTGLSHKDVGAWATSGAGAPISSEIYDRLHSEIAARGNEMIRDSDIQPMADRIISDVAAQHGEKIQEAVRKSGMISRVAIGGQGAQSVGDRGITVGAQYDSGLGADKDRKLDARGVQLEQHQAFSHVPPKGATLNPTIGSTPPNLLVTDKSGQVTDMVVPQSDAIRSPASKVNAATSAASRSYRFTGGLQPPIPTKPISEPSQRVTSRRSFTGNGMMGIGMLASTAMMGMEMAGKEVPMAAQFATQGLMGIGMAAQMFPSAGAKLTAAITAATAGLSPFAMAATAVVAAVAGTALLWRKINEDARNSGVALSNAMNDATTGAEGVASAFNNTSYVQERKLRESGVSQTQLSTAQQFLQSETGKQFMADYGRVAAETSGTIAASSMGAKIASWVVQGVLTGKDVKGLIVAMNEQSPGSGNVIAAQARQYLGGDLRAQNPAETSRRIFDAQRRNTTAALDIMNNRAATLNGPTAGDWLRSAGKQVFGPSSWIGTINAAKGLIGGDGIKESLSKIPLVGQFLKAGDDRGASERLTTATATVWSSSLKTAFQNRLAVEAQLINMRKERSKLERKKEGGTASAGDLKRLKQVQSQIDKTTKSQAAFNNQIDEGFKNVMGSANVGDQKWYDAQLRAGRQNAKKDQTGMYGYSVESIDSSSASIKEKNTALASINTGLLSPQAFSTITANGKAIANVSDVLKALPSTKVQEMGTALDNMTGPQATNAVSTYGKQFKQMTSELKLSPQQKADLADALGLKPQTPKGINPGKMGASKMPKELIQKIRQRTIKDKDADKKPKDQTFNVKAKADTDGAKKKVDDLGKTADKVGKKKINIQATANVGGAAKKIKGLGAAVGGGAEIEQTVNRVIGTDQSKTPAAPLVQLINRIIAVDMTVMPPPTLPQIINRILGNRPEIIPPSPVEQVVNRRVVGGSATGGPFTYAAGGVHQGDGKVTGPGGPTDDKVNARLSNGEYVIRASSVQKYGKDFMNAVNTGAIKTFKSGGIMSKAGNLKADEKKSLLDDSNATIREVNAMSDMTKALKKVLGKGKGGILYDIVRSVMDSFDPKQIKELFKNKGKLKTFGKAFVKQQQLDAKDQLVSAKWDRRAAVKSGKSLAFGASGAVQSSLSADDMKLSARMPGMWDKILTQRTRAEKANQNAGFNRQISRSDASIFGNQLRGNQSLAQAAEALGVSLEDIANKLANSKDYDKAVANIIKMGNAAKAAKEYMDALAMSDTQRTTQRISNNDQRISNLQALAAAKGRQGVQEKFGKSQSVIEAENAVSDAQNAIAQAQIDDINEKYDKQLNILDQIGQHQQAIANLERGRMSVANALSQGDIAAAASAAQQQRNDMAQFARDQMRNQLENQQKAATAQLQQQINDRMRVTRDYQNQIALITAEANANQAVAIGDIQAQSDGWMTAGGYVTDMNAELERQNGILALTTAQLQAAVQAQAQLLNVNPPTLPPASGTGKRMSMSVGSGKGGGGKGHKGKGKGKAFGGFIPGVGNSDSVPTMLTPGEFVVRKAAAAKFGPMLKDMNYGSFQTGDAIGGGNVKIDNVVFNINGANLNEREVADIAVRKMHSLNSATIRGGRF